MGADELLEVGVTALAEGRWVDACGAFEAALGTQESPAASDGLGTALWWLGATRDSVRHRELAYAGFCRSGELEAAALTAVALSTTYASNLGNRPAANGWLGRAERLLADTDPNPLQGWLWLMRGWLSTEPGPARRLLELALEFGRAVGDPDLELVALSDLGVLLVVTGDVRSGLALIDESLAGTFGGEPRRLDTAVFALCNLMGACSLIGDVERAAQWCRVADQFMARVGCPFLYVSCRTKYGGLLVATGDWVLAETELAAAVDMAGDVGPPLRAEALVRLADLRLRQGRLEEAELLLAGLDEAVSGRIAAEVLLVKGEPAAAAALLERHLDHLSGHDIERVKALRMLVEAHLAGDDVEAAGAVADELGAAGDGGSQAAALSALASARVAAAEGRTDDAVLLLEKALSWFSGLDLPLETARVRLALARSYAERRPGAAVVEAQTALAVFDRLGAATDADMAAALLRSLGVAGRTGPKRAGALTKREQEVLGLVGLGLTNPEIAQRLFISRKTAAHHVSNLLAKLGLRNRAEAVAFATRSRQTASVPGRSRAEEA